MAEFTIDVKQVKRALAELDEVISKMNSHYETLQRIRNSLSSTVPKAQHSVDTVMAEIQRECRAVRALKNVGEQIVAEVTATEIRICAVQAVKNKIQEFVDGVAQFFDDLILTKEEREEIENEINDILSKNPDVVNMSDEDKQHLIDLYEQLYPSQGKNMDSVLEPMLDAGYNEHAQNIKVLAYTAEEPYRSVFLDNVGDVNILDLDCDDTQHYSSSTDGVYLDVDAWKNEAHPTTQTYTTFFHECSHAIDYHSGKDGVPYTQTYKDASGNTLNDTIENNVRQDIRDSAENYLDGLGYSDEEKASITSEVEKAIMNCADIHEPGSVPTLSSTDAQDCYDAVVKDVSSTVYKSSSDIYGGMTGNTLNNGCWHPAVRTRDDGTKWSYWTNGTYDSATNSYVPNVEDDGSLSYKPSIGKEFFAENMAAYMTGDTDEMKGIDVYSDDTRDYFNGLVNSINN